MALLIISSSGVSATFAKNILGQWGAGSIEHQILNWIKALAPKYRAQYVCYFAENEAIGSDYSEPRTELPINSNITLRIINN